MAGADGGGGASARAVRAAFGLALLILPVQHVVSSVSAEPYPGLYQPSFGGRVPEGDVAVTLEPEVTVVEADGEERSVAHDELLPTTRVLTPVVFEQAFLRGSHAQDAATAAWLRERLTDLDPGSDPRALRIVWREVEHDLGTSRARVLGTVDEVVIDVGRTG